MHARKRVIVALIGLVCLYPVAGFAAVPKNLLKNPGFESVDAGRVLNWTTPEYWSGSIAPATDSARSGRRAAQLTAADKRGKHWGRILQSVRTRELTGRRFRYSMWARGSGQFMLGCIEYRSPEKYKPPYKYRWQAPVRLGPDWREVVFEFSVSDPDVRSLALVAELDGEGSVALLDDARFERFQQPGFAVRVEPSYAMVLPGQSLSVEIRVEKNGEPLKAGRLAVLTTAVDADAQSDEAPISTDGLTLHTFSAPADATPGLRRLVIAHPDSGAVTDCYLDVTDRATWDKFTAAAKRATVRPLPAQLLFIGDSLTDQQRGYNYVDKLAFWLRQSYGSKLAYRNAGVGGDFISRVWQRMNADPKSYRLQMYDDLFRPKPTHVFFFLGHNDSKVSSTSGYVGQCVDPETFEREYRLALGKVQKETGAKLIVMSATSSVFEICKANADKRQAAGRAHSLFGMPRELERFNTIARRVATEVGADYVDLYEPTRTHPEKPTLFNPRDGVHLSAAGNDFIALRLLEYFGRE